jgi:hypothetical protein
LVPHTTFKNARYQNQDYTVRVFRLYQTYSCGVVLL